MSEVATAGDVMSWGSLLVALATGAISAGGVLPTLINSIQSWLTNRRDNRSITIQVDRDILEVKGLPSEEQRRLIDSWIRRQEANLT